MKQEFIIEIKDKDDTVKASVTGEAEVFLYYCEEYKDGDSISIKSINDTKKQQLWLSVDDALGSSLVFMTGEIRYQIPFGLKRTNLSPKAFFGNRHLISIKPAKEFEIKAYRNLAKNVCDQNELKNVYPHAFANVETRNEAVFAAQNAIDGNTFNLSHGDWPYGSWGINQRADATITVDFGRKILTDCIVLYTRADFPHDNYWTNARITFSDGTFIDVDMQKSIKPHTFTFKAKETSSITLSHLVKSDEASPFPALTQLEVYGVEVHEGKRKN